MGEFKYLDHSGSPPSRRFWNEVQSVELAVGPQKWFIGSMMVTMLLCFALFVIVFVALVNQRSSVIKETISQSADQLDDSALMQREIQMIKNQFGLLLSNSIDNKLHTIEKKIRSQSAGPNDVVLVEGLKSDFDVLTRYTLNSALAWLESDHLRGDALTQHKQAFPDSEVVLQEVTSLQNLIYVGIASFSCIIAAMSGLWLQNYFQIRKLNHLLARSPLRLEKGHS